MFYDDRPICVFLESQPLHTQFEVWPLHVTIVPWFRLPDSSESVAQGLLAQVLAPIGPFTTVAGDEAMFGPKKTRWARLIMEPSPFSLIAQKSRVYLHKKRAFLIDETTKRLPRFHPHVTAQRTEWLKADISMRLCLYY